MEDFIFKGVSASSMGVILEDKWTKVKAQMNHETVSIDGRHGALYNELNYSDVQKNVGAILLNPDREDEVISWLKGEGEFTINGRSRIARIYDSIEFSNHGPFKKRFVIPFLLEPFCYANQVLVTVAPGATKYVHNLGTENAYPILRINNRVANNVITINGISFTLRQSTNDYRIDCRDKSETDSSILTIGYEYPYLSPGENIVTAKYQCDIAFERRDWWLG